MQKVETIREKKINKEDGQRNSEYIIIGVFQKKSN